MDLITRTQISRADRRADAAVEGNARLTAANAAVLLVILAAEGFTLLGVRQMLTLRLLGPVVVVLTVVLLASGVALLFVRGSDLSLLLKVHKASFILWFGAMTIHVQWLIAASLAIEALLGVLTLSQIGPWLVVRGQ